MGCGRTKERAGGNQSWTPRPLQTALPVASGMGWGGVVARPGAWKVCPLPCSLGPGPGLGGRVPVLLHNLPAVSPGRKLQSLGLELLTCQVGMSIVSVARLPSIAPRSGRRLEKFRLPGVWPPCQSPLVSAWPLSELGAGGLSGRPFVNLLGPVVGGSSALLPRPEPACQ